MDTITFVNKQRDAVSISQQAVEAFRLALDGTSDPRRGRVRRGTSGVERDDRPPAGADRALSRCP